MTVFGNRKVNGEAKDRRPVGGVDSNEVIREWTAKQYKAGKITTKDIETQIQMLKNNYETFKNKSGWGDFAARLKIELDFFTDLLTKVVKYARQ